MILALQIVGVFILGMALRLALGWSNLPRCTCCHDLFNLNWESSRTMYHWEGKGEDPNADILLCTQCAVDHHEYWDNMWDEYNRGRL